MLWHEGRFDISWPENARAVGCIFRLRLHDGKHFYNLESSALAPASVEETDVIGEGPLVCEGRRLSLCYQVDVPAVHFCWQATLCAGRPYLILTMTLTNLGKKALTLREAVPWEVRYPSGDLALPGLKHLWNAYIEGWQSWSFSGSVAEFQRQPHSRWTRFNHSAFAGGVDYPTAHGHFISHGVAVLSSRTNPAATLIAGFLRQHQHFGVVEIRRRPDRPPDMALRILGDNTLIPPGATWQSEPAYLEVYGGARREPLQTYAELAGQFGEARSLTRSVPVGWSSERRQDRGRRESEILRNLDAVVQLATKAPLDLVQIDEDYQGNEGNWRANNGFSHGLAWLAEQIQAVDKMPGLWLAPFTIAPHASLVRTHPDWILRRPDGKPVNVSAAHGHSAHALDVTNPDVQAWTQKIIRQAVSWGYRFLKLDNLYAAALPGKHCRSGLSRAQIAYQAYHLLREAAGEETFLLGCSVPLGSAVGVFDAVRVGPDVAPHWLPRRYGLAFPFRREWEMPSLRNALRNAVARSVYHRRLWLNDPATLILRRRHSSLTDEEMRTLLTVVGLSGGLVIDSDDLSQMSEREQAWLAALLPPLQEGAVPLELMQTAKPNLYALHLRRPWGEGHRLALLNWDDEKRTHTLELGPLGLDWQQPYHLFEFWSGRYYQVTDGYVILSDLPPHSARLFAIQPLAPEPQLLATTFHLSMGGEVDGWKRFAGGILAHISLGRQAAGALIISCPSGCRLRATQSGDTLPVESVSEHVYAVSLTVDGAAEVELRWA